MLKAIMGEVNPSGKLSETYPVSYEDTPSAPYFPSKQRNVEYREGLYVGYRYFETVEKPVLFPFGYGLSYTTYEYSHLHIETHEENRENPVTVSFRITNTGKQDGAEVVQIYEYNEEYVKKVLYEDGYDSGRLTVITASVRKMHSRNIPPEEMADLLDQEQSVIDHILKLLREHPEAENEDIAKMIVSEKE